jgi:hypothetical protein
LENKKHHKSTLREDPSPLNKQNNPTNNLSMSGVLRVNDSTTQYHVHVTTRSGQNKPRLIEVDTHSNTFTLSNFSNGKATIAREFDLRNLTKFERLPDEIFLRIYFVSPAVSCDLSFPDLHSLADFIETVKEYNGSVIDHVIVEDEEENNHNDGQNYYNSGPNNAQTQISHSQPPPSSPSSPQLSTQQSQQSSSQQDLTNDIHQTQQQTMVPAPIDQKKLINKWRELLDKHGSNKHDAYKAYVRQGIPSSIRAEAWIALSGLPLLKQQAGLGYYRNLISLAHSEQYQEVNRAIDQGLNITDPKNASSENLARVCRILRAYNVRNINVGYSQQLVFICALLISVLGEEDAFWMMVYFIEHICCVDISANNNITMQQSKRGSTTFNGRSTANLHLEKDKDEQPPNHLFFYHHTNQLGLQIDQAVFGSLLQDKLPKIAAKLTQLSIPIPPLTSRWFTAVLIHTLRADIVLRVWDCVLFDGVKALFRAYLTIFKWNEKSILKATNRNEFIAALQEFASSPIDPGQFVSTMHSMWLRSFSISDVVHYRRLHANVLISAQQLEESEQQRILNNIDQSPKTSSSQIDIKSQQDEEKRIRNEQEKLLREQQQRLELEKQQAQQAELDRIAAETKKQHELDGLRNSELAAAAVVTTPTQPPETSKTSVPTQTQSAPVARVISSLKHNRLFMTASSQNRPPAINIYGSKRAFSPPLPDCYADGEPMSDYTDEEADEIELPPQVEIVVVAKPAPEPIKPEPIKPEPIKPEPIKTEVIQVKNVVQDEDAPPPPPEDDNTAPPPPPDDDGSAPPPPPPPPEDNEQRHDLPPAPPQDTPVISAMPPPVNTEYDLPPMVIVEDDTMIDVKNTPNLSPNTRGSIVSGPAGFRRPTFSKPSPSPVAVKQTQEMETIEDDELPPSPEELAQRKKIQDERLREKAKLLALESIQKQNIKDVMASMPDINDEKSNDKIELQAVPDSSDDEAEVEIEQINDDNVQEEELPPNAAEDSDDDDDDEIVNPFGKKQAIITQNKPEVQDVPQNTSNERDHVVALPPPLGDDEDDGIVDPFGKKQPIVENKTEEPVAPVSITTPIVSEDKSAPFRRPLFKTKKDLENERLLANQQLLPSPPTSTLPPPPQHDLPQHPSSEFTQQDEPQQQPGQENKAKAIIQRSLLRNRTLRQKNPIPAPPEQSLPAPPPSFDLPAPPGHDEPQQQQQQNKQETQEAVFWPTEPVQQPYADNSNGYIDPLAAITHAVGPIIDPARRCGRCSQQIFNNALFANNQLFHQHCFSCTDCRVSLAGIPYYTHNGNAYCQEHYAIAKGFICVYCQGSVTEGITLGAHDYAHFHCLHCATCQCKPSQQEISRLANGESVIANHTTFHLSKLMPYRDINKGKYYQFLCHQHYVASRQNTPTSAFSPPVGFAPPTPTHGVPTQPLVDPHAPRCHRCELPLDSEFTKVQGNQYHKACLGCPICNTYIAAALKKPQGILFSEKKKGTFYCCDHTNVVSETCKGCQEPLLLEPSAPEHPHRYHSYCVPSTTLPSTPRAGPPVSTSLPATPTASAPQTPRAPVPQTPRAPAPPVPQQPPQQPPCTVCGVNDPALPAVLIRTKTLHKKCLECITCHVNIDMQNLKTFPIMMYPSVFRNFQQRQPDYATQDAYYASHWMSPTNQIKDLPVGLICSYCYEAYITNQ